MVILGELRVNKFARRYAAARKPLQRFLDIARRASWPHFPAVKGTFPTTDYVPDTKTLIFNIGGSKYRLVAHVDFGEQMLVIHSVMTHEEYSRETL